MRGRRRGERGRREVGREDEARRLKRHTLYRWMQRRGGEEGQQGIERGGAEIGQTYLVTDLELGESGEIQGAGCLEHLSRLAREKTET